MRPTTLRDFGFPDISVYNLMLPQKNGKELIDVQNKEDFKKATTGEVVKLEKAGDIACGFLQGIEESKRFAGSWAIKYRQDDTNKVVFVNKVGYDLFMSNVNIGQEFILEHKGMKKTQDNKSEYHTYELLYK